MKKKILLLIITLVIVSTILTLWFLVSKEEKINYEQTLIEVSESFYENYYYESISGNESFLENYEDTGIKLSLETLFEMEYVGKDEVVLNLLDSCDKENTITTFYPSSPYGKKDYKIETIISCE